MVLNLFVPPPEDPNTGEVPPDVGVRFGKPPNDYFSR